MANGLPVGDSHLATLCSLFFGVIGVGTHAARRALASPIPGDRKQPGERDRNRNLRKRSAELHSFEANPDASFESSLHLDKLHLQKKTTPINKRSKETMLEV